MLSYRHAYHAGNFADVLKHTVMAALAQSLTRKDKPFFYLDTHAGAGGYDLASVAAEKTGEWRQGIGRIWSRPDLPAMLQPYLDVVRAMNPDGELHRYPGSPRVVRHFFRGQDRMWLCELHPRDVEDLRAEFEGDRQVKVAFEDGFHAIKAQLPPKERRGLVLFDPSYEIKTDFRTVVDVMQQGHSRFATGTYVIWYPVLQRRMVEKLWADVARSGVERAVVVEQCVLPDGAEGMTGSGMIVVNPPWQFEEQVAAALPWLTDCLAQTGSGRYRLEWLAGTAES